MTFLKTQSSTVPNYNPRDLIANIRRLMHGIVCVFLCIPASTPDYLTLAGNSIVCLHE